MPETVIETLGWRGALREYLRVAFVLAVWAFWIPCLGFARGLFWLWEYLRSKRWRWITGLAISGLLILAGIKLAPLVYGRFALVYEAEFLARTASLRSNEEICNLLSRKAFQLGYTSAINRQDAFTIEHSCDDDGISICTVSIDLCQRVDIVGPVSIPFRIRTHVTKAVDPAAETPKSLEDWIFGA